MVLLGRRGVIWNCRVSIPCNKGHLDDQDSNLTWELERKGFDVVGIYKEVASADAEDRTTLELAALNAKEAKTVLVSESTDRYVRGFCCKREADKPRRIAVPPNVMQFERFLALVHGAKIATLWHPDLSEKEVRKLQSERCQSRKVSVKKGVSQWFCHIHASRSAFTDLSWMLHL